jgi:hypothetical protein
VSYILVGPNERRNYLIGEEILDEKFQVVYKQLFNGNICKIYDVREKKSPASAGMMRPLNNITNGGVFLSDMTPLQTRQSHGKLQYNTNFNLQPITLKGKVYLKGLGTHANSEIFFSLKKRFQRFECDIGLDDTEAGSPGSIIFKVYVDSKIKYRSQVIRWNSETERICVNVKNSDELKLIVEDAGDSDTCDHASWAGAILY